jgi:FkbM family methyltransferase
MRLWFAESIQTYIRIIIHIMSQIVLNHWGYRSTKKTVEKLVIHIRKNTTDATVIKEVLTTTGTYQNRNVPLVIEPTDVWLDLGANIGTFSLLVLSRGARVIAVEPEMNNVNLLTTNLNANFDGGFVIEPRAVSTESRKVNFFLCRTPYNNYRHSMHLDYKRECIQVEAIALADLLVSYPDVNAIKLDVEGEEIPLLESLTKDHVKNVHKLVFEYSFDVDTSIKRFKNIIEHLESLFDKVVYRGVPNIERWDIRTMFPPCRQVWCIKT